MKILYYECKSGISGDMNLGALLDLGVSQTHLREELSKLGVDANFSLEVKQAKKCGITGTKVSVKEIAPMWQTSLHVHRNFSDIKAMIEKSELKESVKKRSIDMFWELALAEGKIHGIDPNMVQFHEVGAIDSIVDIVGCAICLESLNVDKIYASRVELGGGSIKSAHGLIPVPAPATLEVLKEVPISLGATQNETTTPTGAVILKCNCDSFDEKLAFDIEKIGYGIGHKDFEIPNVLRVFLGKASNESFYEIMLEANIDDMSPEIVAFVMDELLENGAKDVNICPITTKKNRLGVKLSVLVAPKDELKIRSIIFEQTTTIGLRRYEVEKITLKREIKRIQTPFGEIGVKVSFLDDGGVKYKGEFEECKAVAKKFGVKISEVYECIAKVFDDEFAR